MELGHQLKSDAAAVVSLDGDRETPFSADVAGDVAVQPLAHVVMTANAPDEKRGPLSRPSMLIGGYLLSREVALRVPSAQAGLTSLFGMGRGVSLPL
jgi:hypothetical protein